jgi:hypothetical protein
MADYDVAPFDQFKGVMLSNRPGDAYFLSGADSANALRNVFIPAGKVWDKGDSGLCPSRETRDRERARSASARRSKSVDNVTARHKKWLKSFSKLSTQLHENDSVQVQHQDQWRKRFSDQQARMRHLYQQQGPSALKQVMAQPTQKESALASVDPEVQSKVMKTLHQQLQQQSSSPLSQRSLTVNGSGNSSVTAKHSKPAKKSKSKSKGKNKPAWALSAAEAEAEADGNVSGGASSPVKSKKQEKDDDEWSDFDDGDVDDLLGFVDALDFDKYVDEFDAFESRMGELNAQITDLEKAIAAGDSFDTAQTARSDTMRIVVEENGEQQSAVAVKYVAHDKLSQPLPASREEREVQLAKLRKQRQMLQRLMEKKKREKDVQQSQEADEEADRKAQMHALVENVFKNSKSAHRVHSKQSLQKVAFQVGHNAETDRSHRAMNADVLKQLREVNPVVAVHSSIAIPQGGENLQDRRSLAEVRRKQPSLLPYLHRCPSI